MVPFDAHWQDEVSNERLSTLMDYLPVVRRVLQSYPIQLSKTRHIKVYYRKNPSIFSSTDLFPLTLPDPQLPQIKYTNKHIQERYPSSSNFTPLHLQCADF